MAPDHLTLKEKELLLSEKERKQPEIQGLLSCILNNKIELNSELVFIIMSYITPKYLRQIDRELAQKMFSDERLENLKSIIKVSFENIRPHYCFFPLFKEEDYRVTRLKAKAETAKNAKEIFELFEKDLTFVKDSYTERVTHVRG